MTEIGTARSRVEGPLKVSGQVQYTADFVMPDLMHAIMVVSSVGKGVITGFDTRAALAHPGVRHVLTHLNAPKLPYRPYKAAYIDPAVGERLHVLQDNEVKFYGQPVAVVVADTLEAAEHGASLVSVQYTAERPVTEIDRHARPLVTVPDDYSRGMPDAALAAADVQVDEVYRLAREHHNPMELHATIARWDDGKLTLWEKTQYVKSAADELEAIFGLEAGSVHVIAPFIGGAFGNGLRTWPHTTLAALAAQTAQRPVKLVVTRRQLFSSAGYRAASRQRFAVGATRDGRIQSIIHESVAETSNYEQHTDNMPVLARFLYTSPNARVTYQLAELDVQTPVFMRGPGVAPAAFAIESGIDELSYELGIDPIDLRMRNEPDRDPFSGLPFSSRRLRECFDLGKQRFGWATRKSAVRSTKDGHWLVGTGTATACYETTRIYSQALARIKADGTAIVASTAGDMGPGTYTSMAQVASDALGLPIERVRFLLGDSTLPPGPPHGGSTTMASVGSAVHVACTVLRDTVVRMAVSDPGSPLHGVDPATVEVRGGRLSAPGAPGRSETYQDILRRRNKDHVETVQEWDPGDADRHYSSFGYGAVFAEVAVDETLGLVRIRRLFAVYDAGKIISPKLAHSQGIGGLVGGIGMALLEQTNTDPRDGRLTNAGLADYLVPVNADVPAVDAVFLDQSNDQIVNPLGVKGLGELTYVGVAAAIANAVYHATGKRVRELPITLDKLL